MRLIKVSSTLMCVSVLLVGCSTSQPKYSSGGRYSQLHDSAPADAVDVSNVKDAIPRPEPKSRYGNPASYVVFGKRYYTLSSSQGYQERGIASWYGSKFHGHRTSSGEPYDMYQMSAAHKTLPLPTYARVTNLRNGKSVVVKINDRGPFHDNRLIDLSYAAASRLEILGAGTGMVEVQALEPRPPASPPKEPAATAPVKQRTASVLPSKPKVAQNPPQQNPPQKGPARQSQAEGPSLYLQVGAFSERSNAEQLKTRLSSAQLPGTLQISEGLSEQKPIYRVRIGPLVSIETADSLTQLLIDQGIESPRVVVD